MKLLPPSPRTRSAASISNRPSAPAILNGPLYRRARFTLPALALCAGAALFAVKPSALAATDVFTGNTALFTTGFTPTPANGDTLVFGPAGASGTTVADNIAALTVGGANFDGIDFGLNASGYTITGATQVLTLNSSGTGIGINDLSANAETISTLFSLASNQTVNVGLRTGSLTLGAISGAGFGLTMTGNGLLITNNGNSYTGVTTLSSGTLVANAIGAGGSNGGLGAASSAAANLVFDGGTLRFTGSSATNRNFTITAGKNANFDISNAANNLTLTGGAAATTGGLVKTGPGGLILGAANAYTGNTAVNQGLLRVDFSQASAPATDIINAGSTLVLGGPVTALGQLGQVFVNPTFNVTGKANTTNSQTLGGLVLNPALSTVSVTANATANSVVLNLGAITHNAGAQVVFTLPAGTPSATNGITTTTANGTVANAGVTSTGIIGGYATVGGTAYATNNGGNIVAYTGYTPLANAGVIASDPTTNVQVNTGAVATGSTANGVTTDINTLSIGPAATVADTITLGTAGANTTTILRLGAQGGIMIAAGATTGTVNNLVIGNVVGNGRLTAGGAANTPGEITIGTFNTSAGNSNVVVINSNIVDNGTGAVTLTIGSTAGVSSSTSVNLAAVNTYTGGTFINSGRVSAVTGGFGTGTVTVGAGAQVTTNGQSNNFNIDGGGTNFADTPAAIRPNGTYSGRITLLGDAAIGGGNGTFTGQITGGFNLTSGRSFGSGGSGTITISNNSAATPNNYTGDTIVSENFLTLGNSNVIPDGAGFGNLVITSTVGAATFNLNGKSETINGLSSAAAAVGTGTVTNNATGASVLTLGNNNQTAIFNGAVTDSGTGKTLAITKVGTGTETFGGTNTYIGATTISAGTLQIGNGGTTGTLALGSAINDNANLAFNRTNTPTQGTDFATVIAGTGTVTQNGTGTLTLSGANTYSGGTIVNNGTVTLLNDQSGATGSLLIDSQGTGGANTTLNVGTAAQTAATTTTVPNTSAIRVGSTGGTGFARTLNITGASAALPTTVTNNGALFDGRGGNVNVGAFATLNQTGSLTVAGTGGFGANFSVLDNGTANYTGTTPIVFASSGNFSTNTVDTLTVNGANAVLTTGQGITFNATSATASALVGNVVLTGGGTLALSANIANFTAGSTSNAVNQFSLGTGGGIINTNNFSTTINTPFVDVTGQSGALTKAGTGTLTLGGASTFTGGTTVNAGALLVNGSMGSAATPGGAVTVNTGGTLGGTGILTVASATVNTGATLAPGATVGAITGTLTLNTTSGLTLNGNLTIGVAGAGDTNLSTNGLLTLSGATLTVNGTLDGQSNYVIAVYNTLAGQFTNFTAPDGYTINYAGTNFGTSDIELDVPEPATWVGVVLLVLGAFGIKARRRKVLVG